MDYESPAAPASMIPELEKRFSFLSTISLP
jgi:hypothetical protein